MDTTHVSAAVVVHVETLYSVNPLQNATADVPQPLAVKVQLDLVCLDASSTLYRCAIGSTRLCCSALRVM